MAKFLNDYHVLVFSLVKIALMLGFFINMGGLLTIIERRQMALIQDRVGPNRALVKVPGVALKGAASGLALLGAAAIAGIAFALFPPAMVGEEHKALSGVSRGFWMLQAGIFVIWSHMLLLVRVVRPEPRDVVNPFEEWLADLEDPRHIFFGGLAAHTAFVALHATVETDAIARLFAFGGPAVLAAALLAVGLYAGYRIPSGLVELRLAGFLHPAADGLKFVFKEDFIPPGADKLLHSLAPIISIFPALVTFAVIPFGEGLCFGKNAEGVTDFTSPVALLARDGVCDGTVVPLQILDINIGILYLFAVAGTGIVGAAIAGWSSDNKWSLLGGLRAASQMVSYEVAIGLSLVGAFMIYGTPRLNEIVKWQAENCWGIFVQPVAFFLFFAALIAEMKRTPFDAPEGESEIIAGYLVEYSSFKFAMFYTGEYIEIAIGSALLTTIFLGGWSMPFLHPDGITVSIGDTVLYKAAMTHIGVTIAQVLSFYVKVILLSLFQIFIRWTLLRFRYDQIMAFGWKALLPSTIGNLVVTGLVMLVLNDASPSVKSALKLLSDVFNVVVVAVICVLVVRFVMLLLAPVERKRFTNSTAAARAARLGGVKDEPMQA